MEIVRLAEPRPAPALRPAALALAVLVNGGLLIFFALTREALPPRSKPEPAIEVMLVEPDRAAPREVKPAPADKPEAQRVKPPPTAESVPSAPRPGHLPRAQDKQSVAGPALWNLVCRQIPAELRDRRPDCREEGDPFAARTGRVTAGALADQSISERPVGDFLGGKFAGKDLYQVEVMLGLRSTSLGTKYHIPVDYGPPDEPTELSNFEDIFGASPIPDG